MRRRNLYLEGEEFAIRVPYSLRLTKEPGAGLITNARNEGDGDLVERAEYGCAKRCCLDLDKQLG